MAEKYRLLKDLPGISPGTLLERVSGTDKFRDEDATIIVGPLTIKLTEWFEPVEDRWKPKDGEVYWLVASHGNAMMECFSSWDNDRNRHLFGNCFRTEALAELAAEKVRQCLTQFHEEYTR
jgi:hypothetical protein